MGKYCFLSFMILVSCQVQPKEVKVFQLYPNKNFDKNINSLESGITKYILKAKNPFQEPIIIPYTIHHQLESASNFKSEVSNDSIRFIFFGESFAPAMGYDTLLANETQRYFISLQHFEDYSPKNSYGLLVIKYHLLKEFASKKSFNESIRREFFIIHKDSSNLIRIHKTEENFSPFNAQSHPIPSSN